MVCNSDTSFGITLNNTEYTDHEMTESIAKKSPNGLRLSTNTPLNMTQATPAKAITLPSANHLVGFINLSMMEINDDTIGTVAQINPTLTALECCNALYSRKKYRLPPVNAIRNIFNSVFENSILYGLGHMMHNAMYASTNLKMMSWNGDIPVLRIYLEITNVVPQIIETISAGAYLNA